ncbi:MAG: hypothetical protein A2505_05835 [Deltaproteobacteria bacterium RIFOXYD12_FULL_55_16]|nr:MAG: hypothetical protein A2505_05835 [Deltaproteobacteria bacterium RIFOXYD12_FULL_55_16]
MNRLLIPKGHKFCLSRQAAQLSFILLGLCLLMQPQAVLGAEKKHPATQENQECVECHSDQEKPWFNGKHGLMGVKCIVCHGATDRNFFPSPRIEACRGCHADQVAQAMKAKGKTEKSCFFCHDRHALTVQAESAKPYHAKGGK